MRYKRKIESVACFYIDLCLFMPRKTAGTIMVAITFANNRGNGYSYSALIIVLQPGAVDHDNYSFGRINIAQICRIKSRTGLLHHDGSIAFCNSFLLFVFGFLFCDYYAMEFFSPITASMPSNASPCSTGKG